LAISVFLADTFDLLRFAEVIGRRGQMKGYRGDGGVARVIDVATGAEIWRLPHRWSLAAVAFSPDGTRVATASGDGSARLVHRSQPVDQTSFGQADEEPHASGMEQLFSWRAVLENTG
jgi:WD40 repeat protein